MAVAALEEAQQLLSSKAWMRILLDECVNQRLRKYLPGHECQSARYAGFGGLKNGELLDAAQAANFEVLLTVDRGIEYQQDLKRRKYRDCHSSIEDHSAKWSHRAYASLP
jgi:hypothetical protein